MATAGEKKNERVKNVGGEENHSLIEFNYGKVKALQLIWYKTSFSSPVAVVLLRSRSAATCFVVKTVPLTDPPLVIRHVPRPAHCVLAASYEVDIPVENDKRVNYLVI